MMKFKDFLETAEEKSDIANMLADLPPAHSKLVSGYKWKFIAGNVLDKDRKHVGLLNHDKKSITIAGPWRYSREFTCLHEIGHRVFEELLTPAQKQEWEKVVTKHKDRLKQNAEENFCMAYANFFAKTKVDLHTHPEWEKFIKKIAK